MLEQSYKTILVGIDGSDQAEAAFVKAIQVAKRNPGATIITAHIVENHQFGAIDMPSINVEATTDEVDNLREIMQDYAKRASKQGFDQVKSILVFGSAKLLMSRQIPKEYQVDLIMVGQSGLNAMQRFMMGSVSSAIVRDAPCDVLVVRKEGEK